MPARSIFPIKTRIPNTAEATVPARTHIITTLATDFIFALYRGNSLSVCQGKQTSLSRTPSHLSMHREVQEAISRRPVQKHDLKTEWIYSNGLRFEVLTCGSGNRLALCLHGFPEVALSWKEQMFLLAELGYCVWAPHQRGYGNSSRPRKMRDYAIENLMADVAGLIDAAGAKETALLGHDWGGIVAWCFASRKPRPLNRLVILNAPHPAIFSRELRKTKQFLRSLYALAFQVPVLPELLLGYDRASVVAELMLHTSTAPKVFPKDLLRTTRDAAAQPGALKAMIDWYRAFLLAGGLRRQMKYGFPVIDTPTLLLWGEKDQFLTRETTIGTEEFVQSLSVRYLPGVSHWVQQDAMEKCNLELRQFLSPNNEGVTRDSRTSAGRKL